MPQPLASESSPRPRKTHWVAGTFYLLLAILGIVATVQGHAGGLLATALFGLYSIYLYRGGRFVVWIW